MRRYATFALALSLAAPARGQAALSDNEQWAVYAMVASRYINVNCPTLYSKRATLKQFMLGRGVSPVDFDRKYGNAIRSAKAVLEKSLGGDRQKMCDHFADFYGPKGRFPGLIQTKSKP